MKRIPIDHLLVPIWMVH